MQSHFWMPFLQEKGRLKKTSYEGIMCSFLFVDSAFIPVLLYWYAKSTLTWLLNDSFSFKVLSDFQLPKCVRFI